jgi:hypothetical protein
MVSEKAWYWLSVIVLALGFSNSFVASRGDWVSSFEDRSVDVAQRVSDHAMTLFARAEALFGRADSGFENGQLAVARVQTRLASIQTRIASREAALSRAQAKAMAMQDANLAVIVCPSEEESVDVPETDSADDSN